jgi:serine protease Do
MSTPRTSVVAAVSGFIGAVSAVAMLEARNHYVVKAADPPRVTLSAPTSDPSQSFRAVAKLVRPSVVNLTRERVVSEEPNPLQEMFERYFNDREAPRRSLKERAFGTGFIVKGDGTCLTNNHVAGGGGKLSARLADGREVEATVIGTDPLTDVAVVKLDASGGPYTPVALGDSDAVEVGDWAIAFGCPFGLEQTVTVGIISAKGRSHVGIAAYEDFLQTDAAINPGNSGGPLVSVQGEAIGINTAIASKSGGYQGVGFTIPINMAKSIMEKILTTGHAVRGWLGVVLDQQEMQGEVRPAHAGALVRGVAPGGPADQAGIKAGDVVVSFDGKPVEDGFRLRLLAAEAGIGRTVPLKVLRDGAEVVLQVTIVERTAAAESKAAQPSDAPETPAPPPTVGITAEKITPELVARFGLAKDAKGVVVTDIAAGSLAAQAGVKPGQIIRSIDGHAIRSMEDLHAAVDRMDVRGGVRVALDGPSGETEVTLQAR